MFAADPLSDLSFVLEFNLPKEISDNQDHIKLPVHHVEIPVVKIPACPIGYKPRPIRTPGEIRCIERYKHIKDVLPLINRWVNSALSTRDKLHSSRNSQFVKAKLYAYKKGHSLFNKWDLEEFCPLFDPNIEYFSDDVVELIFKFENIVEVDDKPMYDVSKYIKEYKDRENNCEYCAYYSIQGGRCGLCSNYDWFVQEIDLKQYIIKRVTEDSGKDFNESDEAIRLKAKVDLRKSVYDDFSKYVEKQKELLDNELELKRKEWSDLQSEYAYKTAKYISDNIDKALESLDSITSKVK